MATIKDVAKEAGLSVSCVSKYLNHPENVLTETKESIEKAIEKLHYTPSVMARSLRTKKTGIIAAVMESVENPFFANIFEELRKNLEKHGYSLVLFTANDKPFDFSDFQIADGVIICFPDNDGIIENILKVTPNIPHVLLHGHRVNYNVSQVVFDANKASYEAIHYLYSKGCRSFLHIAGAKGSSMSVEKGRAINNFLCTKNDAYLHTVNIQNNYTGGIEAIDNSREILDKIDGIICESDALSAGAIYRLNALGYGVPNKIRVIGYDNIPISAMFAPPITTVSVPRVEMCENASTAMIALQNGKTPVCNEYQATLIERISG